MQPTQDKDYQIMMVFAREMINQLKLKYPSSTIDDWQGYLVQRLSLMLQSYLTYNRVVLEDKDYITANTILRMMADNLAISKFIYLDHEGDMRLLRHYLFLLDGSRTYINLSDSMEDYENMIKEERNICMEEAQYIKEQIIKLPIYNERHHEIDILIDNGNWKFKKISDNPKNKKYSYQDLYERFEVSPNIEVYLKYISQFAHGLSLYSLGTVASIQNVPFLLELRDMLLRLLIIYTFRLFPEYSYNNDIFIESLRTKLSHSEMEHFLKIANRIK